MAAEAHFIETIIGVGILLFAAKLMAELFLRLKLPIVLGELLAGMIVGPLHWVHLLFLMENSFCKLVMKLRFLERWVQL